MRKVVAIFLLAVLASCGGPSKVGINLWVELKRPQGVSEEDYKRLSQIFPHIPVNVLLEVKDEDGKPKASQSSITRPSVEGKFGAKFEQEVESDDTVRLVVYSEKIVNISAKTEETKFEDAKEKNICVEEETPKESGIEYICRWDITAEANFSKSVNNYLKIRERLSSSKGKEFCDIYSESMRLIENLEEEVKDLAHNDIAEIYKDFTESKWEKYRAGLVKIDEKNFSAAKDEFEDILKFQCLPSDLLTLSKKNLYLSEIQERFSTSKEFCSVYSWATDFAEKSDSKIKSDLITAVEGKFKEFLSKKWKRYSELREKIEKMRDYRGVKLELESEEFKNLGCLPDDFHNSIAKLSNLCDSLKIFDEALEKERRGDLIGAAKRIKDAIDITPDFLEGIIKVADIYFSLKIYDDAKEYYQKALRLKDDPVIAEKLGDTFYIMRYYESALSEYKKAVDMSKEKEKSSLFGKIGKTLLALSKYQDAVGYLKEAIRIAQNQKNSEDAAEYLTLYGNALKSLERYDEAISSYEEAIKSYRDYAPAYKELAFLLADRGKYEDAEVKFEKLMFLDSPLRRDPDVIIKYAETLEKLGKKELATKKFEEAELSLPSNAYLKYKVAVFYSNKEGYEKVALSKFKDAIKLDPKNLDYKLELARFYIKIGIPEGAKAELSDILKIDPQNEKAKTMYFESSVASLKGSLSKLKLSTKDIEILDSALTRMSWESREKIFSTTGISKEMFDKISLYQKIAVLTFYMDKTFETPNRKNKLVLEQIATKYLELIPDIPLSLAKKLASISSANFGLK